MKKTIIYARVSSVGDRQSTNRQVADLNRYAQYANLEIKETFEEHISGAKKNTDRTVLLEAIKFAKENEIDIILISELSRLGRNAFEVLATIKDLIESGINVYFQKEQFTLLDDTGKPSLFAPIMVATLSTCAQLERENIFFRLQSGRKQYIANGGKLGRKAGSTKDRDKKMDEYKQVLKELHHGTSVRRTAKLCDVSFSTVARLKKEFSL